ncbi:MULTISPECIES: hypothetical protein [unclassified Pseudoalteromonas]|uniref:hypothetical protein n=1 Tax=unclassified Pseudoalteromonas TaxID=194690 RepID=UPI00131A1691|nr:MULTISPECIES: hypothetical protein [unclassified Pseudoalteromonas]
MAGWIMLFFLLASPCIPYLYAKRMQATNAFLFFALVIGLATIVQFLFFLFALPFMLIGTFLAPQLSTFGFTEYVQWLIDFGYWLADYIYILLIPLHLELSRLVYRKYAFFRDTA